MAVEFWRMGASPVPVSHTGLLARSFENDGWDGLAVGEAHGVLPDPYAQLAAAAAATTRLKLGTAVAVPLRTPYLAASAMATIHALSGGRTRFCIARGDGAMKVLGREPISVAEFTTYLDRLQSFLRGGEAEEGDATASLARMPVLDTSYVGSKPPVDVAATGARMIASAARLADGISFAVGADLDRLDRCIQLARTAREDAGLDPDTLSLGCYVQVGVVTGDDASGREAIRGLVMTHARFSGYEGQAMADVAEADHGQIRGALAAMDETLHSAERTLNAAGENPNEVDFYPPGVDEAFLHRFGIVGSPEECAARLSAIVDRGISRVYIGTRGVGADPLERNTSRIGREVLPLVRAELQA